MLIREKSRKKTGNAAPCWRKARTYSDTEERQEVSSTLINSVYVCGTNDQNITDDSRQIKCFYPRTESPVMIQKIVL